MVKIEGNFTRKLEVTIAPKYLAEGHIYTLSHSI